jgi:hypothetical protein
MGDEYWATMSIYDHRAPYYRPSLLLFDRVVMPVPTQTWKGLADPEELEQLSTEADWLQEHGCALRCEWDPREFAEWQANELNASTTTLLSARVRAASQAGDAELNTRYQLQWLVNNGALHPPEVVQARPIVVPLFGSRHAYQQVDFERFDDDTARQVTVDLVLKAMPTAPPDVPLEEVVRLRDRGFLTHQVGKLRAWQMELLQDLAEFADDSTRWSRRIERAEIDLRNAVADYERAMSDVVDNQRRARLTTLFSVLRSPQSALGQLFTEHRDDFSLIGQHERCWKALYEKDFAFAGVICTAEDFAG